MRASASPLFLCRSNVVPERNTSIGRAAAHRKPVAMSEIRRETVDPSLRSGLCDLQSGPLASWEQRCWRGGAVDAVGWASSQLRSSPTSLTTLQARIVAAAARRGYLVADTRIVDLEGTGQRARLFVLRKQDRFGEWLASDDLRMYDLSADGLALRLSFRPMPVDSGRPVSFDILGIRKIGDREVILGTFHEIAMGPFLSIPVVIDWDAANDRYRIKPLLAPERKRSYLSVMPRLLRFFKPGDYAEGSRSYYLTPVQLKDPASKISFLSYTTEDATFIRDRLGDLLLASFIVRARAHADLPLLQLAWWRINILQDSPVRYLCNYYSPRNLRAQAILVRPKPYEAPLEQCFVDGPSCRDKALARTDMPRWFWQ